MTPTPIEFLNYFALNKIILVILEVGLPKHLKILLCGLFLCKINIMEIKIIKDSISKKELWETSKEKFGNLVKAVIDIEQGIMAIGGELHADEEVFCLPNNAVLKEKIPGESIFIPKKPETTGLNLIQ